MHYRKAHEEKNRRDASNTDTHRNRRKIPHLYKKKKDFS